MTTCSPSSRSSARSRRRGEANQRTRDGPAPLGKSTDSLCQVVVVLILRRKQACRDEQAPVVDALHRIDAENVDRGAANGRLADEPGPAPREVILPPVGTRVEEPNEFVGVRVKAGRVAALRRVAVG